MKQKGKYSKNFFFSFAELAVKTKSEDKIPERGICFTKQQTEALEKAFRRFPPEGLSAITTRSECIAPGNSGKSELNQVTYVAAMPFLIQWAWVGIKTIVIDMNELNEISICLCLAQRSLAGDGWGGGSWLSLHMIIINGLIGCDRAWRIIPLICVGDNWKIIVCYLRVTDATNSSQSSLTFMFIVQRSLNKFSLSRRP